MGISSSVASGSSIGLGLAAFGLALALLVLPGPAPLQPTTKLQGVALPTASVPGVEPTATPVASGFLPEMVTLHAQDQSLRSILQQISGMTGVTISVAEGLADRRLSVDLEQLRPDEALRQVLSGYDSFFLYGADDVQVAGTSTLKAVWVYQANQGKDLSPAAPNATGVWAASTLEFQQLMSDPDPTVRARAIDTVIRRTGRESAETVAAILKNTNEQDGVRVTALNRALSSGVEIPQEVLINLALYDQSVNIRYLALHALPVDPRLRWVAERALQDDSSYIGKEADAILEELDSSAAPAERATRRP